jgi:hypothetical protein
VAETPSFHLDSDFVVPSPILFNPYKHHAGALRRRIARAAAEGEAGLPALAAELVVIGSELMDLYTGSATPASIGATFLGQLETTGRLEPAEYRAWLAGKGYDLLDLPEDGSRWVFRVADGERYVHLHPGRWVPQTMRVRANVLKSAVMVLACAAVRGGDPLAKRVVNTARVEFLGLSPVGGKLSTDQGLGEVLSALRAD